MIAALESRHARGQALTVLLGSLSTLGPFSNDSILPIFPSVQSEFAVSGLEMQQVLTVYFLPFAIMMLLHGTLSDALGRRRTIILGMAAYALAALVCASAQSFEMLLLVLDLIPERRGFASSVIGFAQSGSSAVLAGAVSYRVSDSALSLATCSLAILACALVCWLSYLARMAVRLRSARA